MKTLLIIVISLLAYSTNFAQGSLKDILNQEHNITPVFDDPHLQFKDITDADNISIHSHHITKSVEVFNKSYDKLFIIDKYGKHIFDLNTSTTKNELLEIPTTSWGNGSYELIAIKNNEAYHHKIVKL